MDLFANADPISKSDWRERLWISFQGLVDKFVDIEFDEQSNDKKRIQAV